MYLCTTIKFKKPVTIIHSIIGQILQVNYYYYGIKLMHKNYIMIHMHNARMSYSTMLRIYYTNKI